MLNANGGDDSFSATGNLAALIKITVDGGAAATTPSPAPMAPTYCSAATATTSSTATRATTSALLGAGDDTFKWDPGDGSDTVEGQAGTDTMTFNGSNAAENIDISANGARVRLFRNVANITMDTNDVEAIDVNALGGADNLVVNDISGTDLTRIGANLAAAGGGDDLAADTVVVNATAGRRRRGARRSDRRRRMS